MKDLWTKVDAWFEDLHAPDPAMSEALATNARHGLPAIDVAPNQARFLHILARSVSARMILEIGTLGGYSTIALARAVPPGGRVVTLEIEAAHAQVARENFERAGVLDRIDLRVAPALETLGTLDGPFDFTFIDADKENYPEYFAHAKRLSRPGALIVLDNVVRQGGVIDPASTDPKVPGTRAVHENLAREPGITWTTVQTVGVKKHDGFTIVLVD